jgi:alanyl-tRNA synthetase
MESAEIRQRFLDYFAKQNHTVVPSASLIANDPTLLLVNAGMVPFKPYFLGEVAPPYARATSVQKCVRTLDIEEVGKTTRHGSFFQMAGNFSFGDYFKEGAIKFAWELLTSATSKGGYGFDPEKLWVTIYLDDEESFDIWRNQVGVPENRIQRRGMADNYWSMGVAGPCGPCSEIYFDRGKEFGKDGGPIADEERYLEVWNLVFMQYLRGEGGGKEDFPILGELPSKNIDTGMGVERMAAILQGVDNIYEIDTTKVILDKATSLVNKKYGANNIDDVRLRVIADHTRTATFLISDGVVPSNEARGYVLRRMMRRVIRNMRLLGTDDLVMQQLVASSIEAMSPQYPELASDKGRILQTAISEEESFIKTLKAGTQIFDLAASEIKQSKAKQLSGDKAFELHDTYGFPIDLTLEMAQEAGLSVDQAGFKDLMTKQRDRAKKDAKARKSGLADTGQYRKLADLAGVSEFIGYKEVESEISIKGFLIDGEIVKSVKAGDEIEFALNRTPFYAEGGGQLADAGRIESADGSVIEVSDVQQPVPGLYLHRGKVINGEISTNVNALARVDIERRKAISRAHTATHMIHKVFREALGETATQLGSENAPGRLRFDFPSTKAVPENILRDAEARVNELLLADLQVTAHLMSQAEARDMGAMALFGEKYGDVVRVVSVGDWAHELCGGTHAQRSAQLGVVKFLSEQSIGAGVRRVEALVGTDAYSFLAREHILVNELVNLVKGRPDELVERVAGMLDKLKEVEKELERIRKSQILSDLTRYTANKEQINQVVFIPVVDSDDISANDLRELVTAVRGTQNSACVVVGINSSLEKVNAIVATNEAARNYGINAQDLLKVIMEQISGKGGGKPDLAQGSGTEKSKIPSALSQVKALIAGN